MKGFEEEIRRAASSYLVTAQKKSNVKFYNEIRLNLGNFTNHLYYFVLLVVTGKRLQTFTRKRIHKRIHKLKNNAN